MHNSKYQCHIEILSGHDRTELQTDRQADGQNDSNIPNRICTGRGGGDKKKKKRDPSMTTLLSDS